MIFRNPKISKPLALLTGIVFLNLSFLLTEMNALELEKKNYPLFESMVKFLSGTGFEEERDVSGETSIEIETDSNDYIQSYIRVQLVNHSPLSNTTAGSNTTNLLSCFREIFSPPPEQLNPRA